MKQFYFISLVITLSLKAQTGCQALYSYGAQFETVNFINHSTASNAHYYWNFGDGTGSNFVNPTHRFLENGKYLVVLYVYDTISHCSDYYETWLNVKKYSLDSCDPSIEDSVFYKPPYYVAKIIDNSTNCGQYDVGYGAPFGNSFDGQYPTMSVQAGNFIARAAYVLPQSGDVKRMALKTIPFFNREKNYNACSANFEFEVTGQGDVYDQTIKFTAMNKRAKKYFWVFVGFGDPILRYHDTASVTFGAEWQSGELNVWPWNVFLKVTDSTGCTDSLIQSILTIHKANTYVGINKHSLHDLKLIAFPNPTKDKISFVFPEGLAQVERLRIINPLGQEIMDRKNFTAEEEICVTALPKGFYFITVEDQGSKRVFRIVKE